MGKVCGVNWRTQTGCTDPNNSRNLDTTMSRQVKTCQDKVGACRIDQKVGFLVVGVAESACGDRNRWQSRVVSVGEVWGGYAHRKPPHGSAQPRTAPKSMVFIKILHFGTNLTFLDEKSLN